MYCPSIYSLPSIIIKPSVLIRIKRYAIDVHQGNGIYIDSYCISDNYVYMSPTTYAASRAEMTSARLLYYLQYLVWIASAPSNIAYTVSAVDNVFTSKTYKASGVDHIFMTSTDRWLNANPNGQFVVQIFNIKVFSIWCEWRLCASNRVCSICCG